MRTGTDPANAPGQRFPRTARVRARAEFDRVFQQGKRAATPLLALHWLRDEQPPRLGLAVSRKVDARATVRNRIKRTLRERFRVLRSQLQPGAYVVVARKPAAGTAPIALRDALSDALRRAGALPPSQTGGTMPAASPDPSSAPRRSGE